MNLKDLEKKTDGQLIGLVKNENMKQAYDVLVLRHYRDAVRFCIQYAKEEQTES